ncbi:hypothetical protein KSP40_PGU020647 [Platanthera guangdongensis]|uniref:Uncharacterized protein n=1 Tax=Platanthera guangdongensis TaxID=2320717 RepID=A0ABR2M8E3_9ASPA
MLRVADCELAADREGVLACHEMGGPMEEARVKLLETDGCRVRGCGTRWERHCDLDLGWIRAVRSIALSILLPFACVDLGSFAQIAAANRRLNCRSSLSPSPPNCRCKQESQTGAANRGRRRPLPMPVLRLSRCSARRTSFAITVLRRCVLHPSHFFRRSQTFAASSTVSPPSR